MEVVNSPCLLAAVSGSLRQGLPGPTTRWNRKMLEMRQRYADLAGVDLPSTG